MYICSVDKYILPTQLEKFNVISLNKILPSFKIDKKLKNNYPDWAYKNGELSLKLILHKDANYNESLKIIQSKYEKVQFNDKSSRIFVTIDESNLLDLASFEFISFIEPIDPPSLYQKTKLVEHYTVQTLLMWITIHLSQENIMEMV